MVNTTKKDKKVKKGKNKSPNSSGNNDSSAAAKLLNSPPFLAFRNDSDDTEITPIHQTTTDPYYGSVLADDLLEETALEIHNVSQRQLQKQQLGEHERHSLLQQQSSSSLLDKGKKRIEITESIIGSSPSTSEQDEETLETDDEQENDMVLLDQAREEHKLLSWYKRPSLLMICLLMLSFTFSTSFGLTSQVELIVSGSCNYVKSKQYTEKSLLNPLKDIVGHDEITCDSSIVQEFTVSLQKWNNIIPGIVRLLVSGKIGKFSDIYGRKPALLFTISCIALGHICCYFVLNPSIMSFNPIIVILACTVESFGGSIMMLVALCNTYVVDISDPDKVNQKMGTLVAFMYFGIGSGPFISSLFSSLLNASQILGVTGCLTSLCLTINWIIVPESRSDRLKLKSRRASETAYSLARSRASSSGAGRIDRLGNSMGSAHVTELLSSLKLLWITEKDSNGKLNIAARVNVLLLIFMSVSINAVTMGMGSVMMLYAVFQFRWTNHAMSQFLAVMMLTRTIILLAVNPKLSDFLNSKFKKNLKKIDFIDISNILICLTFEILGFVVVIIARSSGVYMLNTVFSAFGALAGPTFHSTILKYNKKPEKNGEFFGCLAFFTNFVSLCAPVIFLTIYQTTLEVSPRIVFVVAGGLLIFNVSLVGLLKTNK